MERRFWRAEGLVGGTPHITIHRCTSEGIRINTTLIFNTNQALLAALAGAHIGTIPPALIPKCSSTP